MHLAGSRRKHAQSTHVTFKEFFQSFEVSLNVARLWNSKLLNHSFDAPEQYIDMEVIMLVKLHEKFFQKL